MVVCIRVGHRLCSRLVGGFARRTGFGRGQLGKFFGLYGSFFLELLELLLIQGNGHLVEAVLRVLQRTTVKPSKVR